MKSVQFRYWFIGGLLCAAFAFVYSDIQSNLSAAGERRYPVASNTAEREAPDEEPDSIIPQVSRSEDSMRRDKVLSPDQMESDEEEVPDAPGTGAITLEEVYVELNNAFESDKSGGPQAASRVRELRTLFQSLEIQGVHLGEVSCTASYCKLDMRYPSLEIGDAIFSELHGSPDAPLASKRLTMPRQVQQEDGSVAATLFVIDVGPPADRG